MVSAIRRAVCVAAVLILLPVIALADLTWREESPAMTILKNYILTVNEVLTENGESPVNSIFSNYPAISVMGITMEDNAEIPEEVEITVLLYYDTINRLELRVSDISRFPVIAASFIKALYGDNMTWEDALHVPAERAKKATDNPSSSFEETVEDLNGSKPQVFYKYDPDPYHNGISWIQMTIVFPLAGEWDGEGLILGTEGDSGSQYSAEDEPDPDYEGFFSTDDYSHLEVFTTATPEPDSAAAEYDFR